MIKDFLEMPFVIDPNARCFVIHGSSNSVELDGVELTFPRDSAAVADRMARFVEWMEEVNPSVHLVRFQWDLVALLLGRPFCSGTSFVVQKLYEFDQYSNGEK